MGCGKKEKDERYEGNFRLKTQKCRKIYFLSNWKNYMIFQLYKIIQKLLIMATIAWAFRVNYQHCFKKLGII